MKEFLKVLAAVFGAAIVIMASLAFIAAYPLVALALVGLSAEIVAYRICVRKNREWSWPVVVAVVFFSWIAVTVLACLPKREAAAAVATPAL